MRPRVSTWISSHEQGIGDGGPKVSKGLSNFKKSIKVPKKGPQKCQEMPKTCQNMQTSAKKCPKVQKKGCKTAKKKCRNWPKMGDFIVLALPYAHIKRLSVTHMPDFVV